MGRLWIADRDCDLISAAGHYLRHSNLRSSVGRTDTLAGKLNASELVGWTRLDHLVGAREKRRQQIMESRRSASVP